MLPVLTIILATIDSFAQCITRPQLDLPPLPVVSDTRPDILPNSYAFDRPREDRRYDDDRSQRFGPPYPDKYDDRNRVSPQRNPPSDRDRDQSRFNNRNFNSYNMTGYDRNYYNTNYLDRNQYSSQDRDRPSNSPFNDDRFSSDRDRFPDDVGYRYKEDRRISAEAERIRNFLSDTDYKHSMECTQNVAAQWAFETDVSDLTEAEALLAQQRYSDFQRYVYEQIKKLDIGAIFDLNAFRQVRLLSVIGPSALPPDQLDRYNRLINDMLAIFNTATICAYEQPFDCNLRFNPDLKSIMAKSRDWNELQYVWTEWRRKTGKPIRDLYEQLIDLMDQIAFYNNFTTAEDYWFSAYESPNFRQDVEQVWSQIQPLYDLLHSYVRRKLREFYGPDKINRNAPIPGHVLGNMYGQSWTNILDIIIPYPGRSFLDVTQTMREQGYNPLVMFQIAEEFFLSLNMTQLPQEFWLNSVIERPINRPILCQQSAWDFCSRHDFRIKMCTQVTHKDFINVHHEMAHIQYFLNYRHLPKVYRDGANPAFHEAISDAIGLSISTPKHLQTLGLIQRSVDDTTYDINFLFAMAADKLAFLPFALSLEAWRADVFSRRIGKDQYNCHYWLLREQYGGIKPPVLRSEMDFDPAAKYHIPANIPYMKDCTNGICIQENVCECLDGFSLALPSLKCIEKCMGCENGKCIGPNNCQCNVGYKWSKLQSKCEPVCREYFVSTILQFQIHRALCRASRQYDPADPQKALHKCDIYRHPEAGAVLKKLMEKGASQPWQQVLEEVIGEDRLDGTALLEYFRPLEEWLRNENLRNQEVLGWSYDGDYCKRSIETANLQVYGGFYNGVKGAVGNNILTHLITITLSFVMSYVV